MSSGDSARRFYDSARQELIQRIHLRDNVLLVYIGVVGTIFGISFGSASAAQILLVIPYLALGAAVIVSQHNAIIGSIGIFLANEIEPFLKDLGESAPQWDTSNALHEYSKDAIWMRSLGHFLLILIPPVTALVLNWRYGFFSTFPEGPLWWAGLVITVYAAHIILKAHTLRRKLYQQTKWRKQNQGDF